MSLIMMYVYYDPRGEIKGITPSQEASLVDFQYMTMSLKEVEKFLTGQANPFDYQVKLVAGKPTRIVKKEPVKILPRTQNQFLTEINQRPTRKSELIFTLDSGKKVITIDVNPAILSIYNSINDDDIESREELEKVVQDYLSYVYVTEVTNPYNLFHQFTFNVKNLFDDGTADAHLPENIDVECISLYTKKIFENYSIKYI